MNPWKKVFATHEEAQKLSVGPWLGDEFPGVALPAVKALRRWVMLRHGSLWTLAQVVDVGPFCEDDDAYVLGIARPRAERLKGEACPRTLADPESRASVPDGKGGFEEIKISNGAGIDLFPRTARQLKIPIGENVMLEWRFVEL